MEQILKNELVKNSEAILKKAVDLSPSYQTAMKNALVVFEHLGIPSKKNEDWKYTNIAKNLSPRFYEQKESIVHDVPKAVLDKRGMIIFNNGVFNKFLSVLPKGIELDALVIEDNFFDTFDSLNFGVAFSPLALKIKKNTFIDFPITIVHLVDDVGVNKIISPRLTITAEENTKVSFLEIFSSTANDKLQYSTNAVTKFKLLANAHIEHVKMQSEASNAVHIGLTQAQVFRDSSFKSMTLDYGLLTARHNINVDLLEAGAEASVHGLFVLKQSEHTDIFSTITHFAPHTTSDQLFKGILAGSSHGIFTGKIIVKKDAQKSASSQLNKNLILSKIAHIDTRPQLLVHADDVKCSHGATVGQLSKEEEFYLESRGIPKERAKRMLCHGFAVDVILKIENPIIRKLAEKILVENFKQTSLSD
ncbi:MAG: Fe-S cluster assembly protein SufD [Bacteriovorax sp.]|nr:Fe-S cluster assembly protein SufD [Bacteriovorax sp.]